MIFREMSKDMSKQEIELVLKMVYPHSQMVTFNRIIRLNYIEVFYTLSSEVILYKVDFLPDDIYVYNLDNIEEQDSEIIENKNILYTYEQFMIAKGYSEIWLNNPYACPTV